MQDNGGLARNLMVEVWRITSGIVEARPWLLATWSDTTLNVPHLVVHDGPLGAALHFDSAQGPYWSSGFARRLTWSEAAGQPEPDEWATGWGEIDAVGLPAGRVAAYALIRELVARSLIDTPRWEARPAAMLSDDAGSVAALESSFPTASTAVKRYFDVVVADFEHGAATGNVAYWHEPFWAVRRNGEPVALIDEAGVAHLPVTNDLSGMSRPTDASTSLADVVAHMARVADHAAAGYDFQIADAATRVGGFARLAELCAVGPAAAISVLEDTSPKSAP